MSRRKAREHAFCLVFTHNFNRDENASDAIEKYQEAVGVTLDPFARDAYNGVVERLAEADSLIEKYAIGWKLSRISGVSLAVLRLAFYEMVLGERREGRIVINEAVELAKKYESPEAGIFVNGILGAYVKEQTGEQ